MEIKKPQIEFEQPSEVLLVVNRYVNIVMAILIVAVLAVGYFFLLSPKIDAIQQIRENTSASSIDRERDQALLDELNRLQREYKQVLDSRQADLDRIRKIFPDEPQLAELFVLVDTLAADRNFIMTNISIAEQAGEQRPRGDELVEIDDGSDVFGQNEDMSEALNSLVIQMQMTSIPTTEEDGPSLPASEDEEEDIDGYENFKGFLDDLERNLRIMDLQSVGFGPFDPTGLSPQQFDFSIVTYYK